MKKELESLKEWKKYLKRDKKEELKAWMERRGIAPMPVGDIVPSSGKEGELVN
ncbi:hypothetical protein LCGC14_1002620 [marine sediment metagenome]|uniref:Uncharacterized protein n=1 Tax=marine sediment metagenome TaxID=412755 RepID=A0A0F9N7E1_9ZZZZ